MLKTSSVFAGFLHVSVDGSFRQNGGTWGAEGKATLLHCWLDVDIEHYLMVFSVAIAGSLWIIKGQILLQSILIEASGSQPGGWDPQTGRSLKGHKFIMDKK